MKEELLKVRLREDYLGCFGEFTIEDPVCKRHCALSLRCAIERDQNTRLELLEEMVVSHNPMTKLQ